MESAIAACGEGQGAAAAFKELGLGALSCSGFLVRQKGVPSKGM